MTARISRITRLAEAQNWRCCWCGVRMILRVNDKAETLALVPAGGTYKQRAALIRIREATFEHVTPKCDGGKDIAANLVIACRFCNEFRANHSVEKAQRRIDRMLRKGTHPHQAWDERREFFGSARLPSINKPPRRAIGACGFEVAF